MLTPMKMKMTSSELAQRMKDIAKEEQELLEREKRANDEFLANAMAKAKKE